MIYVNDIPNYPDTKKSVFDPDSMFGKLMKYKTEEEIERILNSTDWELLNAKINDKM